MKKKLTIVICLTLMLVICSCSNGDYVDTATDTSTAEVTNENTDIGENTDEVTTQINDSIVDIEDNNSDYNIVCNNDGNFIVFDDPSVYKVQNQQLATVIFSSMKEFRDSVIEGRLTEQQKRIMVTAFPKDDKGAIVSCDFNNLYIQKLPEDGWINSVSWSGSYYSFSYKFENGSSGYSHCFTKSQFDEMYKRDYLDFFNNSRIVVTKMETLDDGKEVIYCKTGTAVLKFIRYTVIAEDKVMTVFKKFRLKMDYFDLPVSSTIPASVSLYCSSDEWYNFVCLDDLTEDPTDEWLSNFELEKYVDADSTKE